MECFICCTTTGKSDYENNFIYNLFSLSYPLFPLSYYYKCKCNTMYSHNKCLINIKKCPSCRKKNVHPNLCILPDYDKYFILQHPFKKKCLYFIIHFQKKLYNFFYNCLYFLFLFIGVFSFVYGTFSIISSVKISYKYSLYFYISNIYLLFCTFFLFITQYYFNQYITKWWLYNKNDNIIHSLN